MNKIIITLKDGSHQVIILPEETSEVSIETSQLKVNEDITNSVVHVVATQDNINNGYTPMVYLTIGETDEEGFRTRMDAMMYATYNGRILAKNATLGYANTEKPISTKPWIRGK